MIFYARYNEFKNRQLGMRILWDETKPTTKQFKRRIKEEDEEF